MTPMADLIIRMTADVARLQKDMRAARTTVDGAMVNIQRSTQRATRAMQGFIGAISIRELAQLSDQFRTINSVLKIATGSVNAGRLAFRQSYETAIETGQAFESVSVIYRRFAENSRELGINQMQVAEATRTVAQSLALSGGSYQSTQAALLQFSQALASGVLRGQELNSVLEQAPRLARLIADGMGIPIGQLRTLAAEGKITAQVMLDALASQKETIDKEFLELPLTFARAINNLKTSAVVLVGLANESTGAFSGLAQAIDFVARNLVDLANVITAVAIGAVTRMAVTYSAMAASAIAASTATSGVVASLAALGGAGPIGLILGAAAALVYFNEKANNAETSAEALAEKLGLANGELERLTQTQAAAKIQEVTIQLAELEAQAISAAAELDNLNNQMLDPEAYLVGGAQSSNKLAALNKQIDNYKKLIAQLNNQSVKTADAQQALSNAITKTDKAGKSAGQTIEELIAKYRNETNALVMSNDEKEFAVIKQALLNEGIEKGTEAYKKYLDLFDQARIERRSIESQLAFVERQRQLDEERLAERIRQEEEYARQVQNINNQIGQSLTDALVEGGVSARDFLIKMFRTLILRPILQPIISGVLGAIGVGAAGAAIAGTGEVSELGQATGLMGVVATVKGAVDAVTGGFAAIGASVGELAVEGGMQLISSGFTEAGATMIEASSFLGSAASVLAGVGAGLAAGTFISGDFKVGGDQMIATGIGTAAGAAIGSVVPIIGTAIGAAIGGALGGLVNRAFGMGPKETFRSGLALDLGAGGLAETSFGFRDTKQKGGLFRSDKEARQRFGVDGELAAFFNDSAMAIANSVKSMTESFGLSTDEINNIQIHGVVETFGRTEEEITAQVDAILFDLQESLIRGLIPNIDAFAKVTDTSVGNVLKRLSASLTVVNTTFEVLGFNLYDVTLAGGDAASKMIDLVGGIEAFTAATSFYYENFYSAEERANKQLEQMTELFSAMGMALPDSRDAFRALVESAQAAGDQALVASLLQIAPSFISMKTAIEALGGEVESVTESMIVSAQELKRIADERYSLETQLLQLEGNTVELRARELDKIHESNRGLQERIYLIEDERIAQEQMLESLRIAYDNAVIATDQAFSRLQVSLRNELDTSLQKAKRDLDQTLALIDTQRQAAGVARDLASESIIAISSVFELLTNEINDLGSSVLATQTSAQARLFITQALQTAQTTGYLPTSADLGRAITQARGGMGSEQFATAFEQQRDNLRLRNELISLQEISGDQLTEFERQLAVSEETLAALNTQSEQAETYYQQVIEQAQTHHDEQLQAAQDRLDALRGIDNSVLSVADAMNRLSSAISAEMSARTAIETVTVPTGNTREKQFIDLYDKVLERTPDAEGLQYWIDSGLEAADATKYFIDSTENKVQEITRMYESILSRAPDPAGLNYWVSSGGSLQDIQQAIATSAEATALRGFANGGYYPGGMAMVGERGPELINFSSPGMVYNNERLRSAMGGGDTAAELRALREDNRIQSRAMVAMQSRMAKVIEQWNGDGLPQERFEGATA
jgi:tape measure domain-containing protein